MDDYSPAFSALVVPKYSQKSEAISGRGWVRPSDILPSPPADSPIHEQRPISMVHRMPIAPIITQSTEFTDNMLDPRFHNDYSHDFQFAHLSTPEMKLEDASLINEKNVGSPSPINKPRTYDRSNKPKTLNIFSSSVVNWSNRRTFDVGCCKIVNKKRYRVTIRFTARREFLQVIKASGPAKEFNLPIFRDLKPLSVMQESPKYAIDKEVGVSPDSDVIVTQMGLGHQAWVQRYESRLTLQQLSMILGLREYKVNLVKDIEDIILSMFDQLCGFKAGVTNWSRGIPREVRIGMINRVYRFSKIYFPAFSADVVSMFVKRGSYCRTQEVLRRKRRRQQRMSRGITYEIPQ